MYGKIRLIPYPKKAETKDGVLRCGTLRLCGDATAFGSELKGFFEKYGIKTAEDGVETRFVRDAGIPDDESYCLKVTERAIEARAGGDAGAFYAAVSLVQLLHNYDGELPLCEIADAPELRYRSFMLDSGRYFFPKEDVFKIVDLCALHKINAFHWHLTEDQGWRIEIDKYPLLTQKGSRRSHTNFGVRPHGGYYTKSDVREIVAYCNARNIQVIPEFDVPGHSQAALACYPWLGCFGRKLCVATHSGVKHDVMCAGKESTFAFVFDVLDELIDLFGENTRYIHIGGDEVVKKRWEICPDCRKRMEENGIETAEGLHAYFINRVAQYVVDKGFVPVIWNPTRLSLPWHEKAVWQVWTAGEEVGTEELAKAACKAGGLVNSDSGYAYLDLPYSDISLKKSYEFVPLPAGADAGSFVGAEAALWSEYVPDFGTACKRMLPRLSALSEKMWGSSDDFDGFCKREEYTRKFLSDNGYVGATYPQAMPGKARAFFQKIVFERRQLHWQGLRNLVDDAFVRLKHGCKKR